MGDGIYSRDFIVQPDLCDMSASMSPLGAFIAFQAISAEHAELLGIGVSAMMKGGKMWVTAHNRIEFFRTARLLDILKAETWAIPCMPEDTKVYRGYDLTHDGERIASGYTEWAILNADGTPAPFSESGFPEDYVFTDRKQPTDDLTWFEDDFLPEETGAKVSVRSTGIDFGRHLNNIAYVRIMLDSFPARMITAGSVRAVEIHYGHPCRENEQLTVFRKQDGSLFRFAIRKEDGSTAAYGSIDFREYNSAL